MTQIRWEKGRSRGGVVPESRGTCEGGGKKKAEKKKSRLFTGMPYREWDFEKGGAIDGHRILSGAHLTQKGGGISRWRWLEKRHSTDREED